MYRIYIYIYITHIIYIYIYIYIYYIYIYIYIIYIFYILYIIYYIFIIYIYIHAYIYIRLIWCNIKLIFVYSLTPSDKPTAACRSWHSPRSTKVSAVSPNDLSAAGRTISATTPTGNQTNCRSPSAMRTRRCSAKAARDARRSSTSSRWAGWWSQRTEVSLLGRTCWRRSSSDVLRPLRSPNRRLIFECRRICFNIVSAE